MMANSSTPQTTQPSVHHLPSNSPNRSQEDIESFLEQKNLEFVSALAPTVIYLVVLMVVGVVGNTVVFLVYYKRFQPSVIRAYILIMCVCDFLINVFAIPMHLLEIRYSATFYSSWGCKVSRTITIFLVMLVACTMVAVSVTRQKTICSMLPGSLYSVQSVYRAVLICAAVSLVVAAPYAVLTGNRTYTFQGTNITGVKCSISDEYYVSDAYLVYAVILATSYVVCVITMSVSYGRIAYHLWRHEAAAKHTASPTSYFAEPVTLVSLKAIEESTVSGSKQENNKENDTEVSDCQEKDTEVSYCQESDTQVPNCKGYETKVSWSPAAIEQNFVLPDSKPTSSTPNLSESRKAETLMIPTVISRCGHSTQTSDHHDLAEVCTNPKTKETAVADRPRPLETPTQTQNPQYDEADGEERERQGMGSSSVTQRSVQTSDAMRGVHLGSDGSEKHEGRERSSSVPQSCQQAATNMPPRTCGPISTDSEGGQQHEGEENLSSSVLKHSQQALAEVSTRVSINLDKANVEQIREGEDKLSSSFSQHSQQALADMSPRVSIDLDKANVEQIHEGEDKLSSPVSQHSQEALAEMSPTLSIDLDEANVEQINGRERRPSSITQQPKLQGAAKFAPRRSINLECELREIPSRTTRMLFVLTVVFVVNYLPYLVMEVLYQVAPDTETDVNVLYICLRSYYINSAINPIVYSFCSCRFRHECRKLFRCKKK